MRVPILKKWRSWYRRATASYGLKIVLFFVAVLLTSSFVVYLVERRHNDGLSSFFESLWWTIVTVSTVGYGDRVPATISGKVFAVLVIFLGIAMMGTVTGRIASFLMERQMKEEKGLLDYGSLRDHFLICGWKREMNRIIEEIMVKNPELDPGNIVMVNKAPAEEVTVVRNDPRFQGIKYVHGDFIEERDLERAGVRRASRVLVLADSMTQGSIQQIDSKTVMGVMSVKNLNRKAYVCAELLDTKFEKYLRLSHCDEILLSRDFARSMLASASCGTGLSHVVNALLSNESQTRIVTRAIPQSYIGKTYEEIRAHFGKDGREQVIGLLENTGNISRRKQEALREAQKNPDISRIIPGLKGVKTLSANDPVINPAPDYCIRKYARAILISGSTAVSVEEAA